MKRSHASILCVVSKSHLGVLGWLLDELIHLQAFGQGNLIVVADLSVSGPTWRRAGVLPLNTAAQYRVREGNTDPA